MLPCLTSAGNVELRQCSVHGQEGFGNIDLGGGEYILVSFLIRYRCYKKNQDLVALTLLIKN